MLNIEKHPKAISGITWIFRILVGVTFIFSGFVKSIDPWGTYYKIEDYLNVIGIDLTPNIIITGVFLLFIFEFCVGIFLLLGCYRKSAPIAGILFMAFMLPLTLWIAVKNPVADCGCFGEALIISNWATFWKNVALTLAIVWLIRFNKRCFCLIRPYIQWLTLIASTLFMVAIGMIGYIYQPLIDFRAYPVGSSLLSGDNQEAEDPDVSNSLAKDSSNTDEENGSQEEDMVFVYSKNGVEQTFHIDDELPDESDGWVFVRREIPGESTTNNNVAKSTDSTAKNTGENDQTFAVWNETGNEEITDDVIRQTGRQILILMPDLKDISMAVTWKINSLYKWTSDNNIDLIGIVNGTQEEINYWKDISLANYPLYTADDTQIKMLVRGNPGIVYINDGKIIWKSSLRALFIDDFQSKDTSVDPAYFGRDNSSILHRISYLYLISLGIMIFFSFLPKIAHLFPARMEKRISQRNEKITDAERRMEEKMRINRDDRGVR